MRKTPSEIYRMRKYAAIAGLLCAVSVAPVVHAQDSVYQRLRQFTLNEYKKEESEITIERFVTNIYPRKYLPLFANTDVDLALQEQHMEICRPSDPEKSPIDEQECLGYQQLVHTLVEKNAWLQQAVRDLQLAALSFEAGVDYYAGRPVAIMSRLPSIVEIWQGDTDLIQSPIAEIKVRGKTYEVDMTPYFNAVESELSSLKTGAGAKEDREQFVGAVWRYRHGFQYVKNEEGGCGNDKLGDGTELQFIGARFCQLEQKLEDIYDVVQTFTYDPPLKPNEIVLFPTKILDDLSVYIWVRKDDVGLMWHMHLDPVLPSLDCSGSRSYAQPEPPCDSATTAILGGTYPPELEDPEKDEGICSHPFAKRGYLCRPVDSIRCPVDPGSTATEEDIHLIGCKTPDMEAPYRWTEAGPNICNEGGWRGETQGLKTGTDTPGIDPDLEPDWCSNCYIDTFCGPCGPTEGFTLPKEIDGRIQVCLNSSIPELSTYLYIHGLVRAQQMCDSPMGTNNMQTEIYNSPDGCCAFEYQAYLASCDAMAEDGVLGAVNTNTPTCAALLTNYSCGTPGSFDPVCVQYPPNFDPAQVFIEIGQYVQTNAATMGLATSCADAVSNPDARVQKIKNSLPQVCTPKCETKYVNTIGNNACMIGQCVEESFERHRMIPGRMPLTVEDEAFPWDSDTEEDPNWGAFLFTPPQLSLPLPPYRPALLARQMDNFLCQINGLPTRTPPVQCSFDPRRRLRLPTKEYLHFWESLLDQSNEQESMRSLIEGAAPAVGSRAGTQVLVQYLGPALHAFQELIQDAVDLLTAMENTEFPPDMCKRNATRS